MSEFAPLSISKLAKIFQSEEFVVCKEPKFQLGDRVFYPAKNRTGIVIAIVNKDDWVDVAKQGLRYIIRLSDKNDWSILEKNLKLHSRKERNNEIEETKY